MNEQDLKQKLLRFQNPPEVVRDQWLNEQGTALDEERGHVLCTLADTRDAEQDYELGEAFREPGQDEGVRMCLKSWGINAEKGISM